MNNLNLTIQDGDATYTGQIATIRKTFLGYEDHGILTAYLHMEWPGGGIGVGGYALDDYDEATKERVPTQQGFDHVLQFMKTVGVSSWEEIPGKKVIVLFDAADGGNHLGSRSLGIANIDSGEVFVPKKRFQTEKKKLVEFLDSDQNSARLVE